MPYLLLISGQSDYLIRVFDRNSHISWQTVQIQINWLPQKPTDLDLHCLQRKCITGLSRTRVNIAVWTRRMTSLWKARICLKRCKIFIEDMHFVIAWPLHSTISFWNLGLWWLILECYWTETCVKTYLRTNAPNKNSNQPVHPCSLIKSYSTWRHFASLAIQNILSEDSDQTAWRHRLIWMFAGLTVMSSGTVNVLKIRTPKFLIKWHMQTVQTQIRLLLKEQSDQGLHCLPFH